MTRLAPEVLTCQNCGKPLASPEAVCESCSIEPNAYKSTFISHARVSSNQYAYWSVVLLSFPIWGTVLTSLLMCKISEDFFYVGVLLGVASVLPIVFADINGMFGVLVKVVLCAAYCFTGFFVIFFLGWMSMCWFCPTC